MYVIFGTLLCWTGQGVPSTDEERITAALVAAFPECCVYYTHDTVGFELVCGEVTLAAAIAAGQTAQVS